MIRVAEERDVVPMLDIYAPYVRGTTITFEYEVPTPEAFLARFEGITRDFPWLVWEEAGAYAWCAEPSIYLRPDARGRGIGRQLYAALEALLSQMGYAVSFAIITGENEASLAFHRALGYEKCAEMVKCGLKFGRWLDVDWLEKRLDSVEIPRNPPIAWRDFRKDAQRIENILGKMSLSESEKV